MEDTTGACGRRVSGVAARARVRMATGTGTRLRGAVRDALARLAAIAAGWREAWERAVAHLARHMRRAPAVEVDLGVLVAARLAEVARTLERNAMRGAADIEAPHPTPIYGQGPSRIGVTDEASPESGRRGMSSNLIYIDETHHLTAPATDAIRALAAHHHTHLTTHQPKDQT